jgi:hypothetical protein
MIIPDAREHADLHHDLDAKVPRLSGPAVCIDQLPGVARLLKAGVLVADQVSAS